jgi:peptide deformylase
VIDPAGAVETFLTPPRIRDRPSRASCATRASSHQPSGSSPADGNRGLGAAVIMAKAMAYLRTILTDNHPTLRKVAKKVDLAEVADPLFQQLLDDMFATMYAAPGIGLAAPQINVSKRVFTVDLQDEDDTHGPLVVINPKFTQTEGEVEAVEGCLSVPGYVGEVTRFEHVVCTGFDRYGKKITLDAHGWFARCLQHEMDHLDGVIYTDKAKNVRLAETDEEKAEAARAAAEGAANERINAEVAVGAAAT